MAESPASFTRVNAVLVTALVVLASALAVAAVRSLLQAAPMARWAADLLAIGLGLSSLLLTYGVTFNNHSVAAGLIAAATALLVMEAPGGRSRGRRLAAGLMVGLAATIDLPAGGAMLAALAVLATWRDRSPPWLYLAAAAGPLLLHAAAQTMIAGSPLPAEMSPHLLGYRGSYWAGAGRWVEPGPRWRFALEFLVGPQGWLTVTPAVAAGLAGLVAIAARRGDPLRAAAVATLSAVVVLVSYYVWGVRRTDFAGLSFGTRHMLAITPVALAFGAVAVARVGRWWAWGLLIVLMLIGAGYAQAGLRDPWSRIERRDDAGLRLLKRATPYPYTTYTR
jgi:hypothetical protein